MTDIHNPLFGDRYQKTPLLMQPATWFVVAAVFLVGYWLLRRA